MKKTLLTYILFSIMSFTYASTGENDIDMQKKHIIKSLLMKDKVISFTEKDSVIISMAVQEAIQSKKYDSEIEKILNGFDRKSEAEDRQAIEEQKAIAANAQRKEEIIESQKQEIKNLQAKVDFLNSEVMRLNEKNNEMNNKFSSLEQSLVLIKNQLVER